MKTKARWWVYLQTSSNIVSPSSTEIEQERRGTNQNASKQVILIFLWAVVYIKNCQSPSSLGRQREAPEEGRSYLRANAP